jgi:hypothetical protein
MYEVTRFAADVIRSVDNSTLDEGIAEESFSQSTQDKFKQLGKTRHLKKELNNAFIPVYLR